jgi:hypothetical protein
MFNVQLQVFFGYVENWLYQISMIFKYLQLSLILGKTNAWKNTNWFFPLWIVFKLITLLFLDGNIMVQHLHGQP